MSFTYGEYLKLDELLSLQHPRAEGPEHDEVLFIIVHQVYELWFKEVLHELDYLDRLLAGGDTPRVQHTLKRVLTIFKILVAQLDILETMTPVEFLTFRDRLESGSGFQSYQFRELEFALGAKNAAALDRVMLVESLLQSLDSNLRSLDELASANADRVDLSAEGAYAYLMGFNYRFGDPGEAAIRTFRNLLESTQWWETAPPTVLEKEGA